MRNSTPDAQGCDRAQGLWADIPRGGQVTGIEPDGRKEGWQKKMRNRGRRESWADMAWVCPRFVLFLPTLFLSSHALIVVKTADLHPHGEDQKQSRRAEMRSCQNSIGHFARLDEHENQDRKNKNTDGAPLRHESLQKVCVVAGKREG
jgi:hypothetical protein